MPQIGARTADLAQTKQHAAVGNQINPIGQVVVEGLRIGCDWHRSQTPSCIAVQRGQLILCVADVDSAFANCQYLAYTRYHPFFGAVLRAEAIKVVEDCRSVNTIAMGKRGLVDFVSCRKAPLLQSILLLH